MPIQKRIHARREARNFFRFLKNKTVRPLLEVPPKDLDTESATSSAKEEPEHDVEAPAVKEHLGAQFVKSKNATFYERDLDLENEIRLLRIEPGEGRIVATLEYAKLGDPDIAEFDALSYCWGKQQEFEPVTINGREGFLVSQHLYAALRRLRRPDRQRLLWIDVMCVKQSNIPERNRSVQLMWRIYTEARRVIIWIGETEPHAETCKRLYPASNDEGAQLRLCAKPGLPALEHGNLTARLSNVLEELERQANRLNGEVWWKRLWVIQEFSRAKDFPTIYIGPHAISWHFFAAMMRTPNHDRLLPFHHLRDKQAQTLLELLFMAKQFQCSDPRDRIYALLGLAKPGETAIVPDYSKPVPQVYEEATLFLIQDEGNVDVLLDERLERKGGGFPSWVPDYKLLRDRGLVQTADGYAAGHSKPVAELVAKPSRSCACDPTITRALKLRALPFGRITARTIEKDLPAPDSSHRRILPRAGQESKPELEKPLQSLHQILEALHIDFAQPPALPLDRSAGVGYLMLDYLFDGIRSMVSEVERFGEWKHAHATHPKVQLTGQAMSQLFQRFNISPTDAKKLDLGIVALWENAFLTVRHNGIYTPDEVWRGLLGGQDMYQISSKTRKRDFFATADGFIGMGPATLEVDDEIVVPFGASRPFVLRKHGDHHVLIGDAVVPGIMSGQLMNLYNEGTVQAKEYYLK